MIRLFNLLIYLLSAFQRHLVELERESQLNLEGEGVLHIGSKEKTIGKKFRIQFRE